MPGKPDFDLGVQYCRAKLFSVAEHGSPDEREAVWQLVDSLHAAAAVLPHRFGRTYNSELCRRCRLPACNRVHAEPAPPTALAPEPPRARKGPAE